MGSLESSFRQICNVYFELTEAFNEHRLPLAEAHPRVLELADELLPHQPEEVTRADAE